MILEKSRIVSIVLKDLASIIRQEKVIINGIHAEVEVKLALFRDDMIVSIESPKKSTHHTQNQLICELNRATGYKVNVKKNQMNNREIKL